MTILQSSEKPSFVKQSRAKIWIRTGLLAIFGALFTFQLYESISAGYFHWFWALIVFVLFLPVGFAMRNLVPMQVHPEHRVITLSLARFISSPSGCWSLPSLPHIMHSTPILFPIY